MRKSLQKPNLRCQDHIFSTCIADIKKENQNSSQPQTLIYKTMRTGFSKLQAFTPSMVRKFLEGKNNGESVKHVRKQKKGLP